MGDWNPWEWLGRNRPDLTVELRCRLPYRVAGVWKGDTIWLCCTLSQAQRRSVLTHEIQHVLRGLPVPGFRQREERIVDELAARRLIPLPDFLRALQWSQDDQELADELWTDVHTVRVRRLTLTDTEKAWIEKHLDDEDRAC